VRRAEPLHLVRTFVDRGPALASLLEALVRREGRGGYLGTLWAACGNGKTPSRPPAHAGPETTVPPGRPGETTGLREPISNRELDVLELLAQRLSYKEIADRLHVSPETVKMHTHNLYQKLEVHGRRQAVEMAVAEGVLRPPAHG
jgi:LuxR family maltose regulon positive regulatory protein